MVDHSPRAMPGIMHDTILRTSRWTSPQLSANAELQLLTPTALTQLFDIWLFLLADGNTSCIALRQDVASMSLKHIWSWSLLILSELQALRQAVPRAIHIHSAVRVSNNHQLR